MQWKGRAFCGSATRLGRTRGGAEILGKAWRRRGIGAGVAGPPHLAQLDPGAQHRVGVLGDSADRLPALRTPGAAAQCRRTCARPECVIHDNQRKTPE
jgi:hypothetical protein